jgi:hypothetical protein
LLQQPQKAVQNSEFVLGGVITILCSSAGMYIALDCKTNVKFAFPNCVNSSDNVSLELVYVRWDFGDHQCDNSRAIPDYDLS